MMADLFPKTPLPCMHVWQFHQSDVWDDYFECTVCGKQMPYCPEDLADIEEEMDYE